MKKFVAALALTLITTASFAQHRPGPGRGPGRGPGPSRPGPTRPGPGGGWNRPMPRPNMYCQVVMVDRFNRAVRTYRGTRDWRSNMCRDALRQCNFDQRRMGNWNLRCVQY